MSKLLSGLSNFILQFIERLFGKWKEKGQLKALSFEVKFRRPNELQKIGLPVEIRLPNFSLVKTGLTSEPMELEPGKYFVISKLPAGQELFSEIEVKASGINTAALVLEESEESPLESESLQHYLVADRQRVLSAAGDLDTAASVVKLRFFKGNLLYGKTQPFYVDLKYSVKEKGFLGVDVRGLRETQIVQLLQTNAPPLNMVLPTMQRHNCQIFITSLIQGKYTLDVHLGNKNADMLLRYSNKGYFQQAELLGREVDAEKLLKEKMQNPIAAAVGAYALLRFNQLERLHDWTENLRQRFEWLPDASAIRGEHLALSGRHKEALPAFLEIESRGLPIFSDGLSYTVERLSTYVDLKPDFVDQETFKQTKNLLAKLQKIAAYTDFREPFTTFTGLDITEPSAESISEVPKDDKAIDLTEKIS
jgi:hypothetical protein